MNGHKKHNGSGLLPFRTIEAAAGGDVDAINKVLKHYEGYIAVTGFERRRRDLNPRDATNAYTISSRAP